MAWVVTGGLSVAIIPHGMAMGDDLRAEEATEIAALEVSERSTETLEVISVYASRKPQKAFDYAGQVSVVEKEQIEDFNPSTLQEVFQAIPGATFDSGPRRTGDAPAIRGIGATGVLIFLDGARQSFLSGHDGRFFIDPNLVQSLEVVRGPSSALYGSSALGGVIAAKTITADDVLSGDEQLYYQLSTGFQSVNDEARAAVTGAWRTSDGGFDLVAHATYRDAGSIALGSGESLPADDEIVSSLLKATARPADDLELFGSWIRYGADATDPQNPQGVNRAGPGNELVFRDAENDTVQAGLRWGADHLDLIDLRLTGYYSDNKVTEDEVESPRTVDRQVETLGVTLDNRAVFALGNAVDLTIITGAEIYRDRQRGLDNATADGTRGGVPDARTKFVGVFAQADLEVTNMGAIPGVLTFTPAIRWDRFDSEAEGGDFEIRETAVTPRIGLSYKPLPQLLFFGNYAEGFRAPNINEAFADGVHFAIPNLSAPPGPFGPQFVSNLFIGNPDLVPEKSKSYEIGSGLDLSDVIFAGDILQVKASYYRSDVSNLIGLDVRTPAGCFVPALRFAMPCGSGPEFNNISQNVNIADARIDGFEASLSYDGRFYYLRANFNAIDGIDQQTGEFLEGTLTPNTLFLDSGFKLAPWDIRLGSRLTVAGSFEEVNAPVDRRDSFVVGDIYMVWQPRTGMLEGLRVDLGIDNIGDTNYEVVNAGVSQPGRNYKVALSWQQSF